MPGRSPVRYPRLNVDSARRSRFDSCDHRDSRRDNVRHYPDDDLGVTPHRAVDDAAVGSPAGRALPPQSDSVPRHDTGAEPQARHVAPDEIGPTPMCPLGALVDDRSRLRTSRRPRSGCQVSRRRRVFVRSVALPPARVRARIARLTPTRASIRALRTSGGTTSQPPSRATRPAVAKPSSAGLNRAAGRRCRHC